MKSLVIGKLVIAVLVTACLTTVLLVAVPTRSGGPGAGEYDPWLDWNDDGKIDMMDIGRVAKAFGTYGQNITKASLAYDSGWVNITDKCGQDITITHNLNITEWDDTNTTVEITGRTIPDGSLHRFLGLTDHQHGWNKTYGGSSGDGAHDLIQTTDDGYALAGMTYSPSAGYEDFWLVKTNVNGGHLWNATYGGTNHEGAFALQQTTDGGYALAGYTNSFGAGNYDFWFVKADSLGNALWNRTYGGTGDDWAEDLILASDGGYVLLGRTLSYGAGSSDFWLVKSDANGAVEWNRTYGGTGDDWAYALIQTGDGGYGLAGYTGSYGANDFWLVKTDANGNHLWNRTYGGMSGEIAQTLIQANDGGYALAGYTGSYGAGAGDFWLVRTDIDGNYLWNRTYGGANQEWAYGLVQTSDGGYAVAGHTSSFGSGSKDFWLVKTDTSGNLLWNLTCGGTNEDRAYALIQTTDGGFAVAGYAIPFGDFNSDFWLVKTDANGNADPQFFKIGLTWVGAATNTVTLRRGETDIYWNYVQVRIWKTR